MRGGRTQRGALLGENQKTGRGELNDRSVNTRPAYPGSRQWEPTVGSEQGSHMIKTLLEDDCVRAKTLVVSDSLRPSRL